MRVFAALLFSSAVVLAPALAGAQATTAPAAQTAQTTTAPAAPATQAAPAAVNDSSAVNLDEIVCKNQPPATGTRLGGGRECHTVREWNQREREAQDITRREQATGMVHPGG